MKDKYFFCYNKSLFSWIHDVKGIDYITVAISPSSQKTFTLFEKSDQLQVALDEYKALNKK